MDDDSIGISSVNATVLANRANKAFDAKPSAYENCVMNNKQTLQRKHKARFASIGEPGTFM